jgi:dienelactone hydrolase
MAELMAGPGSDEAVADDARRRITSFFDEHLRT